MPWSPAEHWLHEPVTLALLSASVLTNTASHLQGWDVNRLYYNLEPSEPMDKEGVEFCDNLENFLGKCDVVTINLPLTDQTK